MKSPLVRIALTALIAAASLSRSNAQVTVGFPGTELLGRPTATSVTLSLVANTAIRAYVVYGTVSGGPYPNQTPTTSAAANQPLLIVVNGLASNTRYYYRVMYQPVAGGAWIARDEHSFSTQRTPGSTFTFTVMSDSHINIVFGNSTLYQTALQNAAKDRPDFHLDLGDTFAMDGVTTTTQANTAYLNARAYFGLIGHSAHVFLALGNHEQEEGWHLNDTATLATSPPVLSANARKLYYANPNPLVDAFYTGNTDASVGAVSGDHLPEDYYAWQWGDALFVVIDPYWYSTTKPYVGDMGGGEGSEPGSGDRWDWTLGSAQYQWLQQTLQNSYATYKFIFAHQVAGGSDDYGRGGAKAVPYVEWGGANVDGTPGFAARRPGWPVPVHQLLVANHVTAFFHGHDHQFAYEKRDGVIYQLVPMAADASYGNGFQNYHSTDPNTIAVFPNSGHLRVTVAPSQVKVDYVRAYLSGAGTNGQLAYSYTVPASGADPGPVPPPAFSPVRIDSGGSAYTDTLGQKWSADTAYSGGSAFTVTKAIANTADQTLYKTARYGTSFTYTIPAPAGQYAVSLKFAELYWTGAGGRVFNVAINGTKVLSNFDIFAAAGAAFKAVDKTFVVTSTGTITIQFMGGSAGNPLVNAIQVVPSAP
jgi:hypothetical protein